MSDGDDLLERFVAAQDEGGAYERALAELRAGRKRSHWMWFVFPQIAGLGRSPTARFFAIAGIEEASEYLEHPVLGPRLLECSRALLECGSEDPVEILGEVDALKLRSSMTLFSRVRGAGAEFDQVLDRFYGGARDPATEERL
jgi:uncharacterized protein (DUF1810 family)